MTMPSSFNATNTTHAASSQHGNGVSSYAAANQTHTSTVSWHDPAGDLGYGIGRLLRGAFDLAYNAWESWWNPGPSQEEVAHQRQVMVYKKGLEECVKHLEHAIDNLRKNPHDSQSLARIKKLVLHYEPYVKPVQAKELKFDQQKYFQPIEIQLER